MRLDDTYDGRQRQMSFPEFRDDFFSVIGNDEFRSNTPNSGTTRCGNGIRSS